MASDFRAEMNNEALRQAAPSVFATAQHQSRSDRYSMIPTVAVVDALRDAGWNPVAAREQKVRNENRLGFQKHELRFSNRSSDLSVGDSMVEMVLTNAHDGSSSYQIQAGIFRPVCANGMVVCESLFAKHAIKHINLDPQDVIDVTAEVIESVPEIAESVDGFRSLALPEPVREAFAKEALMLRYGIDEESQLNEKAPVTADKLLTARRSADAGDDLWATLNVIQENVIRGGLSDRRRRRANGKRFGKMRQVKGIDQDQKLNKSLFRIAQVIHEQMA